MTHSIKYTKLDRTTRGPAAYEKYNALAKFHKKWHTRILLWQLIVLLLLSILPSIGEGTILEPVVVQLIGVFLIMFFLVLMIIQFTSNHVTKWQRARFLAESTLSETWFLLFSFDGYSGELDRDSWSLRERIKNIEQKLKFEQSPDDTFKISNKKEKPHEHDIQESWTPTWVSENFNLPLKKKVELYIDKRIDDQIKYYRIIARKYDILNKLFFSVGLSLNILGACFPLIISALFPISFPKKSILSTFAYEGFFIAIAATGLSWMQIKRYEEVSSIANITKQELIDIKDELTHILKNNNEENLEKKVFEAEKLISREHKVKRG